MSCRKCIFPRNCENYDAEKCNGCLRFENAVPTNCTPVQPDWSCFKCKHDMTCIVSDTKKKEVKDNG